MISEAEAVSAATDALPKKYEHPRLVKSRRKENLEEFPGRSGWEIWFSLDDAEYGPYRRPVEVDGETGEARLVKILL